MEIGIVCKSVFFPLILFLVLLLGYKFKKNKKLVYMYTFLITLLIRTLFLFQDVNYGINSDRIGDLIAPATIAGRDWSLLVKHVNYYGYGFKWIYSLFFAITSDPYVIYYCVMVLDAILMSLISILVVKIIIDEFEFDNSYIASLLGILMGIVQPGDFKSEPSLYMAGWILCYLFLKALRSEGEKDKNKYTIMIAVFLSYCITLHERMIAIIIAFCIIILFCRLKFKEWIVSPKIYFIVQIVTFALVEQFNKIYRLAIWGVENVGNSSVVYNDKFPILKMTMHLLPNFASLENSKFTYFFTLKGFKIAISCLISNLITLMNQTYGLACIAIVLGIILIFTNCRKLKKDKKSMAITIWIFGLSVMIVFAGLIVNWAYGVYDNNLYSYKGYVYWRYYLNFVYPALVAAIVWIIKYKTNNINLVIGIISFKALFDVFTTYIYPNMEVAYNTYEPQEYTSDTAIYWLVPKQFIGDLPKDILLYLGLCSAVIFAFIVARKFSRLYKYIIIFVIIFICYIYTEEFNLTYPNVKINDNAYENTYEFIKTLEKNNIDISNKVIYCDSDPWQLQYMINEYTIEYDFPKASKDEIFVSKKSPKKLLETSLDKINLYNYWYVRLSRNEYFYFNNYNFQSELKQIGYECYPINKVISNVDEKTLHIENVDREYRIVVLNDLHIICPNDEVSDEYKDLVNDRYENMMVNSNKQHSSDIWNEMAYEVNRYDADLVVFAGDMIDYFSQANISCLERGMEQIKAPIMYIRSDHDYSLHYTSKKYTYDDVQKRHSKIDGNRSIKNFSNDYFSLIGINNSYEEIPERSLNEVSKLLEKKIPTVIVTHVPYDSQKDTSFRDRCMEKRGMYNMWGKDDRYEPGENMNKYLDLIYHNNVVNVLSAHLHYSDEVDLTDDIKEYVFAPSFEGNIGLITIR